MYASSVDITLVCRSCHLTSTQVAGARPRTICPHCAELYTSTGPTPGSSAALQAPIPPSGENGGGDRKPSRRRPYSGQYSRPVNATPDKFPALHDKNVRHTCNLHCTLLNAKLT